jgi:hypothetical protein
MRGLSYSVTTETSAACRHNKSQYLQQKCGTWGGTLQNFTVPQKSEIISQTGAVNFPTLLSILLVGKLNYVCFDLIKINLNNFLILY